MRGKTIIVLSFLVLERLLVGLGIHLVSWPEVGRELEVERDASFVVCDFELRGICRYVAFKQINRRIGLYDPCGFCKILQR